MLSLRMLRRAATAALATTLLSTGTALADVVPPDAVEVEGVQNLVDLGTAAPGEVLTASVSFELVCSGLRHADPGQTVLLAQGTTVVPDPALGGSISATGATIGPVPATWPSDLSGANGCPSPAPRLAGNEASVVTIVAPTVPGDDYELTIFFDKALTPAGVNDASSVTGLTAMTYRVDVVEAEEADTTPPELHDVPAGIELVTSDPSGAALDYTPPTATDDLDPEPIVTCDPAPGALAPVGASEVTCTAADASGNAASATTPVLVRLATVLWEEPVGNGGTFATRGGRSIPVKVRAWLDGVEVVEGSPGLVLTTCGGEAVEGGATMAYQLDPARWMGHLDTAGLAPGCYRVSLTAGGVSFGSFELDVGSATATRARGPKPS
ncbi:MAG: HYR domain-containing protein [Chloroflexi bacterium]|nr:HYR domain-containing protein [Chloroflexota bacterium]